MIAYDINISELSGVEKESTLEFLFNCFYLFLVEALKITQERCVVVDNFCYYKPLPLGIQNSEIFLYSLALNRDQAWYREPMEICELLTSCPSCVQISIVVKKNQTKFCILLYCTFLWCLQRWGKIFLIECRSKFPERSCDKSSMSYDSTNKLCGQTDEMWDFTLLHGRYGIRQHMDLQWLFFTTVYVPFINNYHYYIIPHGLKR